MGKKPVDKVYIYIERADRELLKNHSIKLGVNMSILAGTYIKNGIDFGVERPGWEGRLNEALDYVDRNRFKSLEDSCPKLAFANGKWVCVRYSKTGPVRHKALGPKVEDADNICKACGADKSLQKKWDEHLASDKKGVYEEHKYCRRGGTIDEKSGRIHCPPQKLWQDQDRCFTMATGSPCPDLKTLTGRNIKKTGIKRRRRSRR